MNPEAFNKFLHSHQWQVFKADPRFRVLAAGRRFGKTELALADIIRAALIPNQVIWYVAPTNEQSKAIVWDRLKEATQPLWSKPPHESTRRIDVRSGSRIFLKGAFKPGSLRGHGVDLIVLDEFAGFPEQAWRQVFRPTLADRQGRALFISTPEGRNHFYDFFERGNNPAHAEWRSFHFTTAQSGLISEDELRSVAEDLDPNSFRQELEAEFGAIGLHRVYTSFDREVNVKPLEFDPERYLLWCLDFNVDPMCTLLAQAFDDGTVHVLDEIVIKPNATTELACRAFVEKIKPLIPKISYIHMPLNVRIYADSSGRQRRTSSNVTDWAIIQDFFKLWVGTVKPNYHILEVNPLVRDRVNAVNSMLRNRAGGHRLFIDPKCKELIRDFEEVSWELDSAGNSTGDIDKSDHTRTHMSDALGYFIAHKYSPKKPAGPQPHPLPLF